MWMMRSADDFKVGRRRKPGVGAYNERGTGDTRLALSHSRATAQVLRLSSTVSCTAYLLSDTRPENSQITELSRA